MRKGTNYFSERNATPEKINGKDLKISLYHRVRRVREQHRRAGRAPPDPAHNAPPHERRGRVRPCRTGRTGKPFRQHGSPASYNRPKRPGPNHLRQETDGPPSCRYRFRNRTRRIRGAWNITGMLKRTDTVRMTPLAESRLMPGVQRVHFKIVRQSARFNAGCLPPFISDAVTEPSHSTTNPTITVSDPVAQAISDGYSKCFIGHSRKRPASPPRKGGTISSEFTVRAQTALCARTVFSSGHSAPDTKRQPKAAPQSV